MKYFKNHQKKLILTLLCLAIGIASCNNGKEPEPEKPIVVVETPKPKEEKLSFNSSFGRTFNVKVSLPVAYETNKNLPVIYLFDGPGTDVQADALYNRATAIREELELDAIIAYLELPEIDLNNNQDSLFTLRTGNFQHLFGEELVPFIDKTYDNDNANRTIMSYHAGASAVVYLMIAEEKENPYFHNFIGIDPQQPGTATILLVTKSYPKEKQEIKLHYSLSSTNGNEDALGFPGALQLQKFSWLNLNFQNYPTINHTDLPSTAMRDGFKFVFEIE